jgi:two-component system nitrogen regulation response regulator GlnG
VTGAPAPLTGASVVIADDEDAIRWVLQRICEEAGLSVKAVGSGREAVAAIRAGRPDVALIDIRLPDMSGLDALQQLRADGIDTPIIIITAQNTMANAVEATKRGAFDYLTKPFDLDAVGLLIRRATALRRMTREITRLGGELEERHELVIGRTPSMQEIYKIIGRVAPTDATVLLRGETGTGKELVARAIHHHSGRPGAFVAVNCSAIPRELLESELFGYERGAFTGAADRRVGKLEAAGEGTVFLDEIADMPLDLQAKLLRVLQEREFTRLGGRESVRLEARVIAATNQNVETAVRERRFREDLFFRLNVVPIVVPPLRERRADIRELIEFFLQKINRDLHTRILGIAEEARDALVRHPWPGNVRELENTLMRAAVLARGRTLTLEDLALPGCRPAVPAGADAPLEEAVRRRVRECMADTSGGRVADLYAAVLAAVERPLFEAVLAETGGNQLRAAEILGVNRNTLRKRLTELGVVPRRGGRLGPT